MDKKINHTSGIPNYSELPEVEDLSINEYDKDTFVQSIEQNDILFKTGEELIYNNSPYFDLGLIIEIITDINNMDYLKEQLFESLCMKNTYYSSTSEII